MKINTGIGVRGWVSTGWQVVGTKLIEAGVGGILQEDGAEGNWISPDLGHTMSPGQTGTSPCLSSCPGNWLPLVAITGSACLLYPLAVEGAVAALILHSISLTVHLPSDLRAH